MNVVHVRHFDTSGSNYYINLDRLQSSLLRLAKEWDIFGARKESSQEFHKRLSTREVIAFKDVREGEGVRDVICQREVSTVASLFGFRIGIILAFFQMSGIINWCIQKFRKIIQCYWFKFLEHYHRNAIRAKSFRWFWFGYYVLNFIGGEGNGFKNPKEILGSPNYRSLGPFLLDGVFNELSAEKCYALLSIWILAARFLLDLFPDTLLIVDQSFLESVVQWLMSSTFSYKFNNSPISRVGST